MRVKDALRKCIARGSNMTLASGKKLRKDTQTHIHTIKTACDDPYVIVTEGVKTPLTPTLFLRDLFPTNPAIVM
jgi:hypothetical protein